MSTSFNKSILVGRLTRDPDYRVNQNAKQFCRFTLAVDRTYKKDGKQEADFINIITFGTVADNCGKYLAKGRLVLVEGSIQTGSYDKNGTKVYTTDIFANNVQFLGGGNSNANSGNYEAIEGNEQSSISGIHQVDNNDDELPF